MTSTDPSADHRHDHVPAERRIRKPIRFGRFFPEPLAGRHALSVDGQFFFVSLRRSPAEVILQLAKVETFPDSEALAELAISWYRSLSDDIISSGLQA
jgi:hypothetical protein